MPFRISPGRNLWRAVVVRPSVPSALLGLGLLTTACDFNELPADPADSRDDGGVVPSPQCDAYDYVGETYDCTALDRCTEEDLLYRTACCECDPTYCNPDPTCGPPLLPDPDPAESCMTCHNGSAFNDYAGPGLSNPHPFQGANAVLCTTCHGGDGAGVGKDGSHVPPPPEIGDLEDRIDDPVAYFNRRTLAGIDKFPDYTVDGVEYTALQYLQFINPGDLRVVSIGRGCGDSGCHGDEHGQWVNRHPFGNSTGIFSGAAFAVGMENGIPEHRGLYEDTGADYGFRAVEDPTWDGDTTNVGRVGKVEEWPERAQFGNRDGIFNDNTYDSDDLAQYVHDEDDGPNMANRIVADSPLAHLFQEAVSITCGDCHLGSAGQNDRYADFRSSGCTSCHMEYSRDGRSRSTDPNVNHFEPANPDAIEAPERSHIYSHQIRNVAKILPNGGFVRGVSDYACVGCHQGSNRTVLQFWGIRLDQNQDVVNGTQYPSNPENFETTADDERLYDPVIGNETFNGRVPEQYLLIEDYDGDGRDDTPADVHFEAGLGCIDCHGSRDVHNGTEGDPTSGQIISRMDQGVGIQCESCHGPASGVVETVSCETYGGETAECAVDRFGNALRHVMRRPDGSVWLTSRLDGAVHFVPQTQDVVVNTGRVNPLTGEAVYTALGSYAMGRADGNPATGIGPVQGQMNPDMVGFSHTDRVDCATCHSSWTNNCVGCHLANGYDDDPDNFFFSNVTGERIVQFQANADFTYQTPVPFYLGVNSRGKVAQFAPGIQMFYRYFDYNGEESEVFTFSDRSGLSNNPGSNGSDAFAAMGHDAMMPHSIRGRVRPQAEGPRYCVACHLTEDALNRFGDVYDEFRTTMANNDFGDLNFARLRQHIGENTGNQINSPLWVHMVSGLGSGLFLFDETGCPENPLDDNANRAYCPEGAPANTFNPNEVRYNLDGLVEPDGTQNTGAAHPAQDRARVSELRQGSQSPYTSGPLGQEIIQKLTDPASGVVLDSWIDADGNVHGNAGAFLAE